MTQIDSLQSNNLTRQKQRRVAREIATENKKLAKAYARIGWAVLPI